MMKKWLLIDLILIFLFVLFDFLGYQSLSEWLFIPAFFIFIGIVITILFKKRHGYVAYFRYTVKFTEFPLINPKESPEPPQGIQILEVNDKNKEWLILSKLSKEEIQKSIDNYLDKNQEITDGTTKIVISPYIHAAFGAL